MFTYGMALYDIYMTTVTSGSVTDSLSRVMTQQVRLQVTAGLQSPESRR